MTGRSSMYVRLCKDNAYSFGEIQYIGVLNHPVPSIYPENFFSVHTRQIHITIPEGGALGYSLVCSLQMRYWYNIDTG